LAAREGASVGLLRENGQWLLFAHSGPNEKIADCQLLTDAVEELG
jgi:hypothetical protein